MKLIDPKSNKVIAYIINFLEGDDINFITSNNDEMQCAYGKVGQTKHIKKHIHNIVDRSIEQTSEFIYVVNGQISIDVYNESSDFIKKIVLNAGSGILQLRGGHEMWMEMDTRYFEIKQGPYLGQKIDKEIIV